MKIKMKYLQTLFIMTGIFLMTSCSNDDGTVTAPGDPDMEEPETEEPEMETPVTETASKTYTLGSVADPDISGTAKFVTFSNDSTVVELKLENTPDGGMHPAHIHFNTAVEGGDIALTLTAVDGGTGESSTPVTALDDGTAITYAELLEYNGYINIHLSAEELGTLVGQGDIGQNELTGESKEYMLNSVAIAEIDGTATFFERVNGEALAIIMLNNTPADGMHPGHIHANSAEEGGDILFTFNPVIGATGISETNVAALADDSSFGYAEVLTVDGYINIHLSTEDLGTLVAQGNIGANEGEAAEDKDFIVTNNGTTSYVFNSGDVENLENPNLTLKRGETYTFAVNASGHPFFIKSVQGNTNLGAYNSGVTNNGAQAGTVTFVVPMDAPDTLFYNCQFHSSMTGTLNIVD